MVKELGAGAVHSDVVPAALVRESLRLGQFGFHHTFFEIADSDSEQMVLNRGDLRRGIVNPFSVIGNVFDVGLHICYPTDITLIVTEIETAVAVPVGCPVDEHVLLSFNKIKRVEWLDIFVIVLSKDDSVACISVKEAAVRAECAEKAVTLASVKKLGIEDCAVRRPAYIGNIGLFRASPT